MFEIQFCRPVTPRRINFFSLVFSFVFAIARFAISIKCTSASLVHVGGENTSGGWGCICNLLPCVSVSGCILLASRASITRSEHPPFFHLFPPFEITEGKQNQNIYFADRIFKMFRTSLCINQISNKFVSTTTFFSVIKNFALTVVFIKENLYERLKR